MLTFLDEQAKYSSRDIPNASQLTFDDGLSAHSDLEGLIQQLDNELDLSVNDESASLSLNQSDLLLDTGNEDENVHLDMEDLDGLDDEESRLLPSSTPSTCTPSAFVNNGISNDGQEGPSTVNMGMALDAEALAELDELSLDDGLSNVGDTAPISSFAPSPSLDSPIENGPSVAVSVTQLKDDRSTPTKAEVQEQTLESPPSTLRPQFLTYPSTPAIPPDLDSPQAFPSIENQSRYPMQDSSSNLMEETRREMQALRELNERLVRVNEEYKDALDGLEVQHERDLNQMRREMTDVAQEEVERERRRQVELQKRIEGLQRELDVAQASQTQMASIRDSLTQEKELDLQAIRNELLLQKERQLQELRQDWIIQKEEIAQTYQKNLKIIQVELAKDKIALQSEVETLHAETFELQKHLSDTQRKRRTKDFEIQCTLVDVDGLYPRLLSLFGMDQKYDCTSMNLTENASDAIYTLCHDFVKQGLEERRDLKQELQKTQSSLSALHASIDELERENAEASKSHQDELSLLKRVHASEVEALKSVYQTSKKPSSYIEEPPTPSIQTKEDLEKANPGLLKELEQSWATPLKKMIREEQTLTIQSLAAQYEAKLKEFQDRYSKDRSELIKQHAEELESMSVRLKASCNAAFSQSVRQAKDQWHTEKTQWAAHWRAKESEMSTLIASLENENAKLSSKLTSLEMELVQKSNAQIETLKAKYLTVLKQMRDDLVRSKKASWTRLEEEWRKRKVAYDQAWMERCQGIHRHIQKDHSECPTCLQSQGSPLF